MAKVYILWDCCSDLKYAGCDEEKIVRVFRSLENLITHVIQDVRNRVEERSEDGYFRIPTAGEFIEGHEINYARGYNDTERYYRFETGELE